MWRKNYNDVASGLATHVRKNLGTVERGAVPVRLVEEAIGPFRALEGGAVVGVFGNDNYIAEMRARREVELIRGRVRELGGEEVGFGLSQDGYTWALLVRCDESRYATETGRALQRELMKITLEDAVARAWQAASEPVPGR
jgi:hypothetical protein